jgi:signal peptidase I
MHVWVVAGYTIPSDSMAPTFQGNGGDGDRVAVFKLHYKLFEPERFDLVAFSIEQDRIGEPAVAGDDRSAYVNMVKRIVAFPGESLQIRDGDLFIGSELPERFRKSFAQIWSMLIPVYRLRCGEVFWETWQSLSYIDGDLRIDREARAKAWTFEDGVLVCDAEAPGFDGRAVSLAFVSEVGDGYLDADGVFQPGLFTVKDLALTLECEILSGGSGALLGDLSRDGDQMGFELYTRESGGGGRINLKFGNPEVVDISPDRFPGLETGRRTVIQFINIDNRAVLICDGKPIAAIDYDLEPTVPWFNNPWFGARGVKAAFHRVDVDRDIHYTCRGDYACREPYRVPDGSYFCLGDNSSSSGDSRSFGSVSRDRIVGRPIMIFYPFRRFRFF